MARVSAGSARTDKLASILLQYPTEEIFAGLPQLRGAAAGTPRHCCRAFDRFLDWMADTPPSDVVDHYVQTFDLRRRCALYLTYFRYGDTRRRGMAMLAFKTAYRTAGFDPVSDELPDYLPQVLEFASLSPRGQDLLARHRSDLELLRRGLEQRESPYASVIEAVALGLPGLGRREVAQVTKAWRDGPPSEDVGLEPFAPPAYLQGGRR